MLRKRSANATALAAIGPRKKRKLDEALDGVTPNVSRVKSNKQLFRERALDMRW